MNKSNQINFHFRNQIHPLPKNKIFKIKIYLKYFNKMKTIKLTKIIQIHYVKLIKIKISKR